MTTPSQGEPLGQPPTEPTAPLSEAPDVPKGTLTVAALSKHLRNLESRQQKDQQETQADRQETQATLRAILATLSTLNPNNTQQAPFPPLSPVILQPDKPPTPATLMTSYSTKSTKLPDAQLLSDGQDPSFENWRIQVAGKLEVNRDHYPSTHAQMLYVFGRTSGDAQKHLQARYRPGSINRFQDACDMIEHLASIYTNPNRERDAKHQYNSLRMKSSETFLEFQTKFLHLAGEGNIAEANIRDDLYDKLTAKLQTTITPVLPDLMTYAMLSQRCIIIDAELTRIDQRNIRVREAREKNTLAREEQATETTKTAGTAYLLPTKTVTEKSSRSDTAHITCYNCNEKGHFAVACPKPKKVTDLKEIEEDLSAGESSGNENP
jgi:Zinc knuckle